MKRRRCSRSPIATLKSVEVPLVLRKLARVTLPALPTLDCRVEERFAIGLGPAGLSIVP